MLTFLACASIFLKDRFPFLGGIRLGIPWIDTASKEKRDSPLLDNKLRVFSWFINEIFLPDGVMTGRLDSRLVGMLSRTDLGVTELLGDLRGFAAKIRT